MDEKEYMEMLDAAIEKLPEDVMNRERFKLPKAEIRTEGKKTIVVNFKSISEALKRETKHFLKYLLNEVGTAGSYDDQSGRVTLQGMFTKRTILNTIEEYVKEFVICDTCNKPDTNIERQGRQQILICLACGARRSVRKL
ncbi:translation initiation factor IF-2 subunit beta [Candidatus Bathyarchaeota archaeon]|nr:translation initiation factor IF-2 subunit beta [Candidatus Bathyarchaeota archaeon]